MDAFRFLFVAYVTTALLSSIGIVAGFWRSKRAGFSNLWFGQRIWFFFQITLIVFAISFSIEYVIRNIVDSSDSIPGLIFVVNVITGFFVTKYRCNSIEI